MSDEVGRRGFGYAILLGVLGVAAYGGAQEATGPVVSGSIPADTIREDPWTVTGETTVSGVTVIA